MASCGDCDSYVALGDGTGECRHSPPLPTGEYRHDLSEFPRVGIGDICGWYNAGAYPENNCSDCPFYNAGNGAGEGGTPPNLTYDGWCNALPPVPTGEYRGDLSEYPKVKAAAHACVGCYGGGGPL